MKLNENLMELEFRAKGFSYGHQLIEEKGEEASRQQLAGCKLPQDQHYQTKVLSRRRTAFEYRGMYYYCGIGQVPGPWKGYALTMWYRKEEYIPYRYVHVVETLNVRRMIILDLSDRSGKDATTRVNLC